MENNIPKLRSLIGYKTDNSFITSKAKVFNGTKWISLDVKYYNENKEYKRINGYKYDK